MLVRQRACMGCSLPGGALVRNRNSTAPGQWLASMRVTETPSTVTGVSMGSTWTTARGMRRSPQMKLAVIWLQ